jgi:hypothetical protein
MACQPHLLPDGSEGCASVGRHGRPGVAQGQHAVGPSACLTGAVVRHSPSLRGLQEALPQERHAGPSIAVALEELQAVDVAFRDAVAPGQGEPRGDRG